MGVNDALYSPRSVIDAFPEFDSSVADKANISGQAQGSTNGEDAPDEQTVETTRSEDLQSQIKEVERQIVQVKEREIEDRKEHEARLRSAKIECKNQMIQALGLSRGQSDAHLDKILAKMRKEIKSRKRANSRLREEMALYEKDIIAMLESNAHLESVNREAEAKHAELLGHVARLEENQKKLQEKCESAKTQMQAMRRDFFNRRVHHRAEGNCCKAYENYLSKILSRVQKKSFNQALKDEILQSTEQGRAEVLEIRTKELAARGLAISESTLKSCGSVGTTVCSDSDTDSDGDSGSDSDSDSDTESEWEVNSLSSDEVPYECKRKLEFGSDDELSSSDDDSDYF